MTGAGLLIQGGAIADGGGGPPVPADVLVYGERIAAVATPGTIPPGDRRLLDATGLIVAPGFIDVHSHADNAPLLASDDTTKILQGVTTEVVGNCGMSLAPLDLTSADSRNHVGRFFPGVDPTWQSWSRFVEYADDLGYVTNHAALLGHGTLRAAVLGLADAAPDAEQLATMGRLLDEAFEGGAFGLSSGLIYPPGRFSDTAELIELARHLGPSRIYATHLRDEADLLLASIAEAARIGAESGCPVHLSHLKRAGMANWHTMPSALSAIAHATDTGVSITKDVYPYTASSTMVTALLPPPFLIGDDETVLARLASPDQRRRLALLVEGGYPGWENPGRAAGWDGVLLSATGSHRYEGHTLAELAEQLGTTPVDALVRILLEEKLNAQMVLFDMHPDDLRAALADPDTMIGSDGLPPGTGGKPHPRLLGTFPRVLGHYVNDTLPLGEAIRRMTSLPARVFRIPERGWLRPGYLADLVAFDPRTIDHRCDYRDPVQPVSGISWVSQAGRLVVDHNRYLGPRLGRRLTPAG
ncbi:N-acyl-D-amino-acid deacylase family protein [Pseudonocardia spinosispora]|uniref:N-acyl-D-amino-acid deacylase family protein n=1 Tax=Pseudonocardia spinosispora TaxID=103441 RepID=UPI0004243546|nr:D-aminoacylase [Pseudonocardia spinosispora]